MAGVQCLLSSTFGDLPSPTRCLQVPHVLVLTSWVGAELLTGAVSTLSPQNLPQNELQGAKAEQISRVLLPQCLLKLRTTCW